MNDADEGIKAGEVGGIGRVHRQVFDNGGDHQVGGPGLVVYGLRR